MQKQNHFFFCFLYFVTRFLIRGHQRRGGTKLTLIYNSWKGDPPLLLSFILLFLITIIVSSFYSLWSLFLIYTLQWWPENLKNQVYATGHFRSERTGHDSLRISFSFSHWLPNINSFHRDGDLHWAISSSLIGWAILFPALLLVWRSRPSLDEQFCFRLSHWSGVLSSSIEWAILYLALSLVDVARFLFPVGYRIVCVCSGIFL